MEKVAKNGRKVKGIALLFCCFLPIYKKWKRLAYVSKRYLVPSNFVDLGIFIYMNICIYIYIYMLD